jgi:hypothetical protein
METRKNPKPLPTETKLALRFAEADYLINALEALPAETKNKVTHIELAKKLKNIKDYWLRLERERKARKNVRPSVGRRVRPS